MRVTSREQGGVAFACGVTGKRTKSWQDLVPLIGIAAAVMMGCFGVMERQKMSKYRAL